MRVAIVDGGLFLAGDASCSCFCLSRVSRFQVDIVIDDAFQVPLKPVPFSCRKYSSLVVDGLVLDSISMLRRYLGFGPIGYGRP